MRFDRVISTLGWSKENTRMPRRTQIRARVTRPLDALHRIGLFWADLLLLGDSPWSVGTIVIHSASKEANKRMKTAHIPSNPQILHQKHESAVIYRRWLRFPQSRRVPLIRNRFYSNQTGDFPSKITTTLEWHRNHQNQGFCWLDREQFSTWFRN